MSFRTSYLIVLDEKERKRERAPLLLFSLPLSRRCRANRAENSARRRTVSFLFHLPPPLSLPCLPCSLTHRVAHKWHTSQNREKKIGEKTSRREERQRRQRNTTGLQLLRRRRRRRCRSSTSAPAAARRRSPPPTSSPRNRSTDSSTTTTTASPQERRPPRHIKREVTATTPPSLPLLSPCRPRPTSSGRSTLF